MQKVLMLDLEGVLIATAIPPIGKDYGARPNAQQFLNESLLLFNKIYLNTCVDKERALRIMRNVFNAELSYYHWDKASPFGKACGYEKFSGSKLIHVEDESSQNKEAQRIIELGHYYIQVPTWTVKGAYAGEGSTDTALLNALIKMKEILQDV